MSLKYEEDHQIMVSYTAWQATESFRREQNACQELNCLFRELQEARLDPLNEQRYQKYALFHHIENTENLVRVLGAILRRSTSDQASYRDVFEKECLLMLSPTQHTVIEADDSSDRFREYLVADFESLYQIGGRLLDKWAWTISHLAALPKLHEQNFRKVAIKIMSSTDNTLLTELKDQHLKTIQWIHSHILVFRDKFIVHQANPFQQSTLTDPVTGSIRISYLIDPVWYGQTELSRVHQTIMEINERAPATIRLDPDITTNPNFVIGLLMEHFDALDLTDQERLVELAKETGFTSPTLQVLAHRLFDFVTATVATARIYARRNPDAIKLGARNG